MTRCGSAFTEEGQGRPLWICHRSRKLASHGVEKHVGDGQRKEQYALRTCVSRTDRRPVGWKEVSHQKNQGPDTWGQGMDFGFYSQSDVGRHLEGSGIEK